MLANTAGLNDSTAKSFSLYSWWYLPTRLRFGPGLLAYRPSWLRCTMRAHTHCVRSVSCRPVQICIRPGRCSFLRGGVSQQRSCHLPRCRPQDDGTAEWPDPATSPPAAQSPQSTSKTPEESSQPSSKGFPSQLDAEIFRMAVPSFCAVIVDPLLGMVDTAIVGQLGGQVLAGTPSSYIIAHPALPCRPAGLHG